MPQLGTVPRHMEVTQFDRRFFQDFPRRHLRGFIRQHHRRNSSGLGFSIGLSYLGYDLFGFYIARDDVKHVIRGVLFTVIGDDVFLF